MRLVRPDILYRDSFLEALREYEEGPLAGERRKTIPNHYEGLSSPKLSEDFQSYVDGLLAQEKLAAQMLVPSTVFWLIEGECFIGRVSVRHYLSERLLLMGGHIGYDIRPSQRNQGYGTKILAMALPEAKRLGIERVLVTCDDNNEGSRRIIEKNGGTLENIVEVEGLPRPKRRYWITLT
jgi:predicted acetyltransferase